MAKIENDVITDLVYEKIKLMILDGAMHPGEKIIKKDLAVVLGVSQTPVNEAINRLVGEKLIEQKKRHGFFIKNFSYKDLEDLFDVRAGLEGISIRLCIEELPDEKLDELTHFFDGFSNTLSGKELKKYIKEDQNFHEKIISLSGNSIIIDFDRNFDFIMKSYQKGLIRPPEETLPEHKKIIQAIKKRDAHDAQELIIMHVLKSSDIIRGKRI